MKISLNAKCRECKHIKGKHFMYPNQPYRNACTGGDEAKKTGVGNKCLCMEFELQVEDRVYAGARELQERLGEI